MDEPDSFSTLFLANASRLVRLAFLLGDDDPEDVVRDSFARLYGARGRPRDAGNVAVHLTRTVVDQVRSRHRHRQMSRPTETHVLTGLPARQREALVLRYWMDLPPEQIADAMDVRLGTVESLLSRSVQARGPVVDEERIRRALTEQADAVDADLTRLHEATLDATRRWARTPRRPPSALVLVAVVAVVAGAMLGTTWLVQGSRTRAPDDGSPIRGVAASFTCPRQTTVRATGRGRDVSFLPSLAGGPAAAAAAVGAPRYEFAEAGDSGTLRLGNTDGSLASVSVFRRTSQAWVLITTTKCVAADGGVRVEGEEAGRLGQRESTPHPARQMIDNAGRAVLIDDRGSYDAAGLARHRSLWAAPCGRSICVAGGSPTELSTATIRADARPRDITSLFLGPDDNAGQPNPWRLWVVADPGRTVLDVRATTTDGRDVAAHRRRGPEWTGQIYVLLADSAAVDTITVRTAEGAHAYPTAAIR